MYNILILMFFISYNNNIDSAIYRLSLKNEISHSIERNRIKITFSTNKPENINLHFGLNKSIKFLESYQDSTNT